MFAEERKQQILALLSRQERVTVQELTSHFGVSESTIRRDLQELEDERLLERTHGGAILPEKGKTEPSYREKESVQEFEKAAIAEAAAQFILPGDTILLDAGTTTTHLAKELCGHPRLTVVTNAYHIASILSVEREMDVILIGGMVKFNTLAAVGPYAESMLKQLNVDKLFLGANGVDLARGVTTPDPLEAKTKQDMIRSAREVFLLADSSKMGRTAFAHVCSLEAVDNLITDRGIDDRIKEEFTDRGLKVTIAAEGDGSTV
ncbi:DeoR/GlpR family DNA-binding transcription regulator [Kroppenstedtia eburnea]|uniref:Transcriptional regulator, DeoR family n=1 Tax=Kroppenstedtia eburnea TaxID=714067 RepID=A0A1N7MD24_9BACL|nr:DeoR/GlpR family DNA-binding transcription regulator [Kroppenstedtia eburnea]EGK07321.1 lactose PTS family porter repressor [Desmospora sp. 8437]QKI81496.1 DeoR/GlpR transcriptional regulator [Kroppenstedtia eburnea]SIS83962.1 transcriptional regulator, DeoR family [Kroppenstedtia eburnea]